MHQLTKRFAHGRHIVKDQQIRDEVIVFDDFSLLVEARLRRRGMRQRCRRTGADISFSR